MTVAALVGAIDTALKNMGPTAALGEILGAGTAAEMVMVGGTLAGIYSAGAMIGSLMVTANAWQECSDRIPVTLTAMNKFERDYSVRIDPALKIHLQRHPEIFDVSNPNRQIYARRPALAGKSQ